MLKQVCEGVRHWIDAQLGRQDKAVEEKIKTLFEEYQKNVGMGEDYSLKGICRDNSQDRLSELIGISQELSRQIEQIATQTLNQRQISIIGDLETNSEKVSLLVQDLAREFDWQPSLDQKNIIATEKRLLHQIGWKGSP